MLKIIFVVALACTAFCAATVGQDHKPDPKLTVDQIVAKHLESIGTPEAIAAAKSRVMVGTGVVTAKGGYVGKLSGPAQLASEGNKVVMAMVFDANNYPYEKVGYDGKELTFGRHVGAPSNLSQFLRANKVIVKRGLFAGVLGSAWPLIGQKKEVELDYEGETEIAGQRMHKVKFFTPDIGGVSVFLYFDAASFRHVRTEYRFSSSGLMTSSPSASTPVAVPRRGAAPDYYTLVESFSNFAKAGDLTLPLRYVIDLESKSSTETMTWTINLSEVYYNETLDASAFKVS